MQIDVRPAERKQGVSEFVPVSYLFSSFQCELGTAHHNHITGNSNNDFVYIHCVCMFKRELMSDMISNIMVKYSSSSSMYMRLRSIW